MATNLALDDRLIEAARRAGRSCDRLVGKIDPRKIRNSGHGPSLRTRCEQLATIEHSMRGLQRREREVESPISRRLMSYENSTALAATTALSERHSGAQSQYDGSKPSDLGHKQLLSWE